MRRGIVYTFQITSVFTNLTCFDNVALAVQRSQSWAAGRRWPHGQRHLAHEVMRALDRVGLAAVADSMDEQSATRWSQPPTWNEIAELVSGNPVVCSVVLHVHCLFIIVTVSWV